MFYVEKYFFTFRLLKLKQIICAKQLIASIHIDQFSHLTFTGFNCLQW